MTGARALPRLHCITSTALLEDPDFASRARAVLAAVARDHAPPSIDLAIHPATGLTATLALHLRGALPARTLHALAVDLHPGVREAGGILLVNDRVDVALTARVDGAHLPAHGIGVTAARAQLGPRAILGASVHDPDEANAAAGADFHLFGNVWTTDSHPDRPAAGIDRFATLAGRADAPPTLAIGGVRPEHVSAVADAGGWGVAVLGGIWSDASPADAAIRYLEAVSDAFPGGAP